MEENRITKVLYNQVALLLGLIGVVVSTYMFLTAPSGQNAESIAFLKAELEKENVIINQLTKTQQNDTQEIKANVGRNEQLLIDLIKQVSELNALVRQHLK